MDKDQSGQRVEGTESIDSLMNLLRSLEETKEHVAKVSNAIKYYDEYELQVTVQFRGGEKQPLRNLALSSQQYWRVMEAVKTAVFSELVLIEKESCEECANLIQTAYKDMATGE